MLLEPAKVVVGRDIVAAGLRAAVGVEAAFQGNLFHGLTGNRAFQFVRWHDGDLRRLAGLINTEVGLIFRDVTQHPLREIGVDRIVGDEDIVMVRSGNGDPTLFNGGREGIEEALAGGNGDNAVGGAMGDQGGKF